MFQIGHSMAIGNVIHKIFYEISSFYSDECDLNFFDFVFKDVVCNSMQSEEQGQKGLDNDLICSSFEENALSIEHASDNTLYLVLSAMLPSGFYFSLIQPPD